MLLFGGSQLSFFFPMLLFGGPQLSFFFPMFFALACCCTQALLSTFPSTKSGFLCAFGVWNPRFRAFRAQNRGFCALLGFETLIFGLFEHKNGIFVLEQRDKWHREAKK
ncbi:MAG: hypothetical protein SPF00_02665 [Candidatus Egerieousia sp.]|nr:hypothetical protein [Candidatus Egerieousia sp.]